MRQLIIALNLLGSFILLALTIDLFDTLFMFALFGILPGQAEPLSANQMLTIYAAASIFVFIYALRAQIIGFFRLFRYIRVRRHITAS